MDIIAYEDYFKNLAKSHKDVRHSDADPHFIFNRTDAVPAQFKTMKNVAVVLNQPIGRFSKDGQVYSDNKRGSFEIHVQVPNKADIDTRIQASNKAEVIGKSFIARMLYDRNNYSTCPKIIDRFKPESVAYEHMESELPNFVTCIFSFDITAGDEDPLTYDSTLWL